MDSRIQIGGVPTPEPLVTKRIDLCHPIPHFRTFVVAGTHGLPVAAIVVGSAQTCSHCSGRFGQSGVQSRRYQELGEDRTEHPESRYTRVLQLVNCIDSRLWGRGPQFHTSNECFVQSASGQPNNEPISMISEELDPFRLSNDCGLRQQRESGIESFQAAVRGFAGQLLSSPTSEKNHPSVVSTQVSSRHPV